MKFFITALLSLSLSTYASTEACKGYSLNSLSIIEKSQQSFDRENRNLNFELQKNLAACSSEECTLRAQNLFQQKSIDLLLNHKNYLQRNYEILATHCSII